MDDPKVEVDCDICGEKLEIIASAYEKAMENEQPILCDACFVKVLDAQEKEEAANKLERKFRYYVDDIEIVFPNLDALGALGWELIHIHNDKAYLKMEII